MDNFLFAIFVLYAVLNLFAFGAYALDKYRAQTHSWRTPENTLLAAAAVGPFGALAAMQLLRHKTRHTKFLLVPVFALVHILFAVFVVLPRL